MSPYFKRSNFTAEMISQCMILNVYFLCSTLFIYNVLLFCFLSVCQGQIQGTTSRNNEIQCNYIPHSHTLHILLYFYTTYINLLYIRYYYTLHIVHPDYTSLFIFIIICYCKLYVMIHY